jgi:hypothetical protein
LTHVKQLAATLGATALLALAGPACGGGGTGAGGSAGSTSEGGGGDGGAAGGNGGAAGSTSTTGGSSTGGSSTGGTGGSGPVDQGVQATAFVSAGGVAKSPNFRMAFTLGQSTQNQGRTKSGSFAMQGGLIGATGSLK